MADQEHIQQGEPSTLTLEDLCGCPPAADYMRHVPEPEFTASARNLHHQLELQHHLLSTMKPDFDQKWHHRECTIQEQMEEQSVSWRISAVSNFVKPMLLITLLR